MYTENILPPITELTDGNGLPSLSSLIMLTPARFSGNPHSTSENKNNHVLARKNTIFIILGTSWLMFLLNDDRSII